MDKPQIVVDKLSHTYPDGWQVLFNLSFSIQAGTTVALAGANGSGKTTLLWLIAGLLQASHGTIQVDGILLNHTTVRQVQQKIGLAFQNPDDQLFMATVRQDVEFGFRNRGLSEENIIQRAEEAMRKTGCIHLANRPPYRLSGGEKRLVSLATILATDTDILLLDEPTNALDPRSRKNTINLLRSLPHTKLIATHDLDMAMELCDEVILLHQGTLVAKGQARQILSDPLLLESAGLELPLSLQH